MPLNFTLVDSNPNDTTGGGGSLAGPEKDTDATGPYFVWPNQEFDSGASPFCVVAASEVRAMAQALGMQDPDEPFEPETIAGAEGTVVSVAAQAGHPGYADYVVHNPGWTASTEYDLTDTEQADAFTRALHGR
jgi:hypothetical protein